MPRVRVLIAEDEPAVRAILSALIDGEPDFVLVAAAEDAVEAIELADLLRTAGATDRREVSAAALGCRQRAGRDPARR